MTAEIMRNDSALIESPLHGDLLLFVNPLSKKPTSPHLELINSGESQTLEFKSSFDKGCIESLVAFANAQGGSVLVGVSDTGDLSGVTLGKETLNEWVGQIKHSTTPSLIPEISSHDIDGKTIVQIQVDEFPIKPVNTKGRYFKRVANSNHALAGLPFKLRMPFLCNPN